MRVECLDNNNFEGKLVKVGKFSDKPEKCVNKVVNQIEQLIKPKDYNLFLQQDYSKNEMRIIADYPFPLKPTQKNSYFTRTQINIPITSKASKYVDAASSVINQFENNLQEKEQQAWEQKQKRKKIEDIKDTLESMLLFPIFVVDEIIHRTSPKMGAKFENLLEKIGIY